MSEPDVRPAVFTARGLTKVYSMGEVEVHALRGVDLDLAKGEFVVLLGPSGSGKSTLLNILGGLDVPSGGQVVYRGRDLTQASEADLTAYRRHHVGFVFQFYNLIPSLTARENVALVTEIAQHPMAPEDALALVGLGARLDHFPAQLSGGEQQRVAIARAIAKRPEVLLCDEPTSALDSETTRSVLDTLRDVNQRLGVTVLIVTHELAVVRALCRTVAVMEGGRLAEQFAVNDTGPGRERHVTALGRELARMAVYADVQHDLERVEAAFA
jgi:putative ABC transport system ATP-binding protein